VADAFSNAPQILKEFIRFGGLFDLGGHPVAIYAVLRTEAPGALAQDQAFDSFGPTGLL
jgi:hypothetical protein